MKKILILIGCGVATAVMAQQSSLPTYATFSGSGTSSAKVIIPQKPTSQARVVSAITTSDLASSTLTLYSGTTARYVIVATNDNTKMYLDATNGLVAGLLYVQGASSNVVATISSYTTTTMLSTNGAGTVSTNTVGLVTLSASLGIAQVVNAEVEVLGNSVALTLGAVTNNVLASDGLYVGNYGRCVYAVLTGTSACAINALTCHYDASSN